MVDSLYTTTAQQGVKMFMLEFVLASPVLVVLAGFVFLLACNALYSAIVGIDSKSPNRRIKRG